MYEETKVQIFQKLSGARQALVSVLDELELEQWEKIVYTEHADWTVKDLFGHLMDSERSMTRLVETIKEGGEGVSPDFDLNRWNARTIKKTTDLTTDEIRSEMITNRGRLLEMLYDMPDEDWTKKGRHGSLKVMSVEEILNQIADHENEHLRDIVHVIEKG
jgi:uncharacterized damage-inducible protein DinB